MIFQPTPIGGLWEIWPELLTDERGAFARTSCLDEFAAHGLPADWSQCSISWNTAKHTLRGLHYQKEPHGEHKLVRCTRGAVFDVAVDLRAGSPTRFAWHSLILSADNRAGLYIPPGLAHGFLTLEDGCEVFYQIRERFTPEAAAGARWNDPRLGIDWPAGPAVISGRDESYPLLSGKR